MRWAALAGMTTFALGLWVRLRRMQAERDQLRLVSVAVRKSPCVARLESPVVAR